MNIKTKHITLDDAMREFLDLKIGSLAKFLQGVDPVIIEVDLSRTTEHHKKGEVFRAEVQIEVPGKLLRAEATTEDLRKSIVDVKDQLQVQIKKYKEKD